jgi:membrane protease YdiL (CAAX protease family)
MAIHIPLHTKTKRMLFVEYSREIMIGFCILIVFFVSFIFPNTSYGDSFWLSLFFFFIFPLLAIRFLLKEPLSSFGFSKGDAKKGIILSVIFIASFILLNYYIVSQPNLRSQLSVATGIVGNFWNFLLFQFFIALPLHFFWETFFRGFMQMGLEKKLGKYSLFFQAILQSLLFFKGTWVILFLIFISALCAGFIVRQSRSILYSFVSMWIISVSLDIMLIRLIHQGIV